MASLPPEECSYTNGCDGEKEHAEIKGDDNFYRDAAKYWESVPSTVNGVMGGFGRISSTDIAGSRKFLLPFIQGINAAVQTNCALDCGAGIGRITKRLLLPLFTQVDLVEQNPTFLEQAKTYLGERSSKVGHYFPVGLQNFTPEGGQYDLIWNQWVLSHLTDDDLVSYLQRCVKGLNPNGGLIIAKENVAAGDEDVPDEEDSSITRCRGSFIRVFERAGLRIIKEQDQEGFPTQLFKVTIFALR